MAHAHRCFVDIASGGECPEAGGMFSLDREESHHLVKVLRARPGDPVVLFSGDGREWTGILDPWPGRLPREVPIRIAEMRQLPPPALSLHLIQAIPKGKTMDQLVRRVVELGVTRISPLVTDHSENRTSGERTDQQIQRWRQQAIEAGKQSGNSFLPVFDPIQTLDAFLADQSFAGKGFFGDLAPGASLLGERLDAWAKDPARSNCLRWFIGPEGDFSDREKDLLRRCGVVGVSFGTLVLRCETAALFALSATLAHWQARHRGSPDNEH